MGPNAFETLTFDLQNKVKVKGQGHSEIENFLIFSDFLFRAVMRRHVFYFDGLPM